MAFRSNTEERMRADTADALFVLLVIPIIKTISFRVTQLIHFEITLFIAHA